MLLKQSFSTKKTHILRILYGKYQCHSPHKTNSASPISCGRQVDEIKRNDFDFQYLKTGNELRYSWLHPRFFAMPMQAIFHWSFGLTKTVYDDVVVMFLHYMAFHHTFIL